MPDGQMLERVGGLPIETEHKQPTATITPGFRSK